MAAGKVIKESDLGDKCKECKEQEANSPLFGACVLRLPLLVALKAYVPLPRSAGLGSWECTPRAELGAGECCILLLFQTGCDLTTRVKELAFHRVPVYIGNKKTTSPRPRHIYIDVSCRVGGWSGASSPRRAQRQVG